MNLPSDGAEYATFTFSPALPDGVTPEVEIADVWYPLTEVDSRWVLLLRGPDAPAGTGVVITETAHTRVRVIDSPEIVIRGSGSIYLA